MVNSSMYNHIKKNPCSSLLGQQWYQSTGMPKGIATGTYGISPIGKRKKFLMKKRGSRNSKGTWTEDRMDVLSRLGMLDLQGRNSSENTDKAKRMKKSRCYLCRQKGHAYWNCKTKKMGKSLSDSNKGKEQAYEDDNKAYKQRYCYIEKLHIDTHYMILGSDNRNWDSIWYINKEYTKHMAQNKTVFTDYKPGYHKEVLNSEPLRIYGMGTAIVNCDGNKFLIQNVSYAPSLKVNILSLPQLRFQGYDIKVHGGNRCEIIKIHTEEGSSVIDKSHVHERLEQLEREASVRITKEILEEYVSNYCDRIGGEKHKGFTENSLEVQNETIPCQLKNVVGFIDLILEDADLCKNPQVKRIVSRKFDQMVVWFYESYIKDRIVRTIPPLIGPKEVCLLDMFKTLKELGGAGEITIQERWNHVTMALGFPEWYDGKIEACYVKNLQQLDVYYDIIKKTQRLFEVPTVNWKGEEVKLEIKDHDSFMIFMEIIQGTNIGMEDRELFISKFDEMIVWFYKDFVEYTTIEVPPKIEETKVCLYDLYMLLLSMGGIEETTRDEKWDIVAMSFGFLGDVKYKFKGMAEKYLIMPDMYFKAVMQDIQKLHLTCTMTQESVDGSKKPQENSGTADTKLQRNKAHLDEASGSHRSAQEADMEDSNGGVNASAEEEELMEDRIAWLVFDDGEHIVVTLDDENEEPNNNKYGSSSGSKEDHDDHIDCGDHIGSG